MYGNYSFNRTHALNISCHGITVGGPVFSSFQINFADKLYLAPLTTVSYNFQPLYCVKLMGLYWCLIFQ